MPSLSGRAPSEGEKNVELDSIIEFFIIDDGAGIDVSSLIVYINGKLAIKSSDFEDGFDGEMSEITPDGDNYLVSIHPEANFGQGEVVLVKLQVKDLAGKYFNTSYVFKTITAKPILSLSSPLDGSTIRHHQVLYMEFIDTIDGVDRDGINIKINNLNVVQGGIFNVDYQGDSSDIGEITDGLFVKIDKKEPFRNGSYKLDYDIPDQNGNILTGSIKFDINVATAVLPPTFPQTGFVGPQGIVRAVDVGIGDSITIEWSEPTRRYYGSDAYILIYKGSDRLSLFENDPSYLAESSVLEATIDGLTTGDMVYFGARALETYRGHISVEGMVEVGDNIFEFPPRVSLSQTIMDSDFLVPVDSTEGFPSSGLLLVGGEVFRYSNISESQSAFIIDDNGRGLNNTSRSVHVEGEEVRLFVACQDSNEIIVGAVPTYHGDVDSDREVNNTGVVVNDYSDNDKKFFQGFDFCGYHTPLPQQIFQGKNDCGSYLGGEFNGFRGMNLFDRMLNREEVLLDQVGEPVILLKRIWDGQTCSCSTLRREHPSVKKCKECFGTGYESGYNRYVNLRREDERVMMSFGDTLEDLTLQAHKGLEVAYEPSCWTMPIPAIKDRDLIVRFDFTNDTEYIYEVLSITKEKLMYKHYTRQRLQLKRLDKTDIVYTFPFTE
tara:strand:+ start:3494 stop:5479 length:1986 start_codon:yes stop_codon:yes gene_type:complete